MTIEQKNRIADELFSLYESQRSGSNFNQVSYRTHLYGYINELEKTYELSNSEVPDEKILVTILHALIY